MGYAYGSDIERVALFLIELLQEKGSVSYDFFYDGTDETMLKLNKAIGFSDDDEESIVYVDLTIYELKEMGIIETEQLSEKLPDDEFNFRIRLTDVGKEFVKSRKKLVFKDIEL
jgi:hypothetical protein